MNGAAGTDRAAHAAGRDLRVSVRLPTRSFEKQPPGRPLSSAMLDTNDGEP